jgi:hypothetical protein
VACQVYPCVVRGEKNMLEIQRCRRRHNRRGGSGGGVTLVVWTAAFFLLIKCLVSIEAFERVSLLTFQGALTRRYVFMHELKAHWYLEQTV